MNRKQSIIISVTGITIVLLLLLGLTFAYYLTNITGNTNPKSISLETADLEITYDNESALISVNALEPGTTVGTKTFTVTNNGNGVVNDYVIYFEKVVNTLTRPQDFVYTISCDEYNTNDYETNSNTATSTGSCGTKEQTQFPTEAASIYTNSINVGKTQKYTLTITYLEPYVDQSEDMGKIISGKINIAPKEELITTTQTLLNAVMKDTRITKNEGTPEFTGVETNEVGMYSAPDDYGTSWYFRGAQSYNYVKFAGFTWRIVRINGDGSIRLILDGTLDKVKREGESIVAGELSNYGMGYVSNRHIGYMFGYPKSNDEETTLIKQENVCIITTGNDSQIANIDETACIDSGGVWMNSYDATHMNINDSVIKEKIDLFYKNYIENETKNYHYGEYLADTLFCGDKSLASDGIGGVENQLGWGDNITYYAPAERLWFENGSNTIVTAKPTLECTKGETNTYSRYTVNSSETPKGVKVNNDLDYPIALLSADELVMAGAFRGLLNSEYYLEDAYKNGNAQSHFWTMSPQGLTKSTAVPYIIFGAGGGNRTMGVGSAQLNSIRPVINLKSDVLFEDGNGTSETPYVIKID